LRFDRRPADSTGPGLTKQERRILVGFSSQGLLQKEFVE
jgi:hypothetical protein